MIEKLKAWRRLPGYAILAWRLFQDVRVPTQAKVITAVALVLVFSPLDFGEWLPIAGPASTVILITLVLRAFAGAVPEDVRMEHMAALGMTEL